MAAAVRRGSYKQQETDQAGGEEKLFVYEGGFLKRSCSQSVVDTRNGDFPPTADHRSIFSAAARVLLVRAVVLRFVQYPW